MVPGTLSFDVARWNHPRSGDILVSANWTGESERGGLSRERRPTGGVAGHGTLESVRHPQHADRGRSRIFANTRPATCRPANVDIAPTLLWLLGIPAPPTMTGRVIEEALRDGPPLSSVDRRARDRDGQERRRQLRADRSPLDRGRPPLSRFHRGQASRTSAPAAPRVSEEGGSSAPVRVSPVRMRHCTPARAAYDRDMSDRGKAQAGVQFDRGSAASVRDAAGPRRTASAAASERPATRFPAGSSRSCAWRKRAAAAKR